MLDELQRDDRILLFRDGELRTSELFDAEIERHLREATHILLGISDDYIKSAYVRTKELPLIKSKMDAGAKVFPLLIKGMDWTHFLEGNRANFLKNAQFWPVVDGYPVPIFDLSVHDRTGQILKLRQHVLMKGGIGKNGSEEIDENYWAADESGILSTLAKLQLLDEVDLRSINVVLPTYLAESVEVDAIVTRVRRANELLYEIDSKAFSRRKILEPPANLSPDEEEEYWAGLFVSLSERSPLSIVALLALLYRQAPGVRKSIENIIDASKTGATS